MQRKIEIPKPTTLVKAKENFRYFNNGTGEEGIEIKKDQILELDNELAKDFIRQGFVEFIVEPEIKEEVKEEIKPLKNKKI